MPEKVKIFVGTMRPKWERPCANIQCSCGSLLDTQQAVFLHWQNGHFDTPVYAEIDPLDVALRLAEKDVNA